MDGSTLSPKTRGLKEVLNLMARDTHNPEINLSDSSQHLHNLQITIFLNSPRNAWHLRGGFVNCSPQDHARQPHKIITGVRTFKARGGEKAGIEKHPFEGGIRYPYTPFCVLTVLSGRFNNEIEVRGAYCGEWRKLGLLIGQCTVWCLDAVCRPEL
jgi:hypothetical protein